MPRLFTFPLARHYRAADVSRALDLLRDRLAATALGARGLTLDDPDGDLLGLSFEGDDTGVRAAVRLVRVPSLASLRVEGRWIEVTIAPSLLAEAAAPVVLVVHDPTGHAVWATREELLSRLPNATADESWQVRLSAHAGVGGFGLHRMIFACAMGVLRAVTAAPIDGLEPGAVRTKTLLRRFLDEGEGFDASLADLRALAVPGWFVATHSTAKDEATVTFATPAYVERLAVELRGALESLTARDCAMRCVQGGALRSMWSNDLSPATVAFVLRLDHARNTLELEASMRGDPASAATLAVAARFVWRFAQGGHVSLLPGCSAAGVSVGCFLPAQERPTVSHGAVETLDALAAIERSVGHPFDIAPGQLADPMLADAVRELLLVRSSGRVERLATSMRLSLTAAEVRRLLDASGFQRRVSFRMPASRVSQTLMGLPVALGSRVQEVTGTLVQSPGALATFVATLSPDEQVDLELSAVEVREFYELASPGAPTTAPTATRGAPSGSRSGST